MGFEGIECTLTIIPSRARDDAPPSGPLLAQGRRDWLSVPVDALHLSVAALRGDALATLRALLAQAALLPQRRHRALAIAVAPKCAHMPRI